MIHISFSIAIIVIVILIIYTIFYNNKDRVVVSLTTSPQRINYIKPVIDAMLNQTRKPDRIYLNLPKIFLRNNSTFDTPLPDFITNNKLIYVNFCDDIGPATKIIPTISIEQHPETKILSIDDDIYYPPTLIDQYLKYSSFFDNCIITGSSFINNNSDIDKRWFENKIQNLKTTPHNYLFNGKLVDLIEGFSGVLYKRKYGSQL